MKGSRRLSKYVRELDGTLKALGYRLDRNDGGHFVYVKDGFDPYTLPGTPGDVRAVKNDIAKLRRRHPDAAMFARKKSTRPKRRARAKQANPALKQVEIAAEVAPAPEAAVSVTAAFDPSGPITEDRREQWARAAADRDRANAETRFPWRDAA